MFRKLLQQPSARAPFSRRRLAFEPLESRLLLSADLAPVEGVLELTGTDGVDFLLLRQLETRLLVALNNDAFAISLEGIERIKVDLGGGADAMILEGSTGLPAVQIDLGEGDNDLSAVLHNPTGILQVVAGEGKDTIDAQADWTGSSVDNHPDFLWLPTFHTGGGNDVVDFSAVMGVDPQPFMPHVKLEATIDTGAGNDVLGIDSVTGGGSSEAVFRVRMGEGDNTSALRFGDGVRGARLPAGESSVRAEYRSGEGSDDVSVKYTMFLADGTPVRARALDLDILTGGGNDVVDVDVDTTGAAAGVVPCLDIGVDAGRGGDQVSVDARGVFGEFNLDVDLGAHATGNDVPIETLSLNFEKIDVESDDTASCWIRTAQLAGGGGMSLALGAGGAPSALALDVQGSEGDDLVQAQILGFGDVSVEVDTRGGNDSIWMDLGFPVLSETPLTRKFSLSAGEGDDTVFAGIRDGTSNSILFGEVLGGTGDDRLDVALSGESGGMALVIDAGDGDDSVNAALLLPAVQAAREAAHRARIDLGDGNDVAALSVETADIAEGISPCWDIGVDAGLGGDDVTVNAKGAFEVFELRVDLGADTSGDVVPVDQVSFNYTAIKFEYNTSATYQYQSGDVARAVYHTGLRSDGELVQAISEKDTIGGSGTDQVNVSVGANRSETVGANMTISVGGTESESARNGLSASYSLLTTLGRSGGATIEGEVHVKGDSDGDSVTLDLSMNDDATRAGFASVSGLTQEITAAQYRGGAAVDNEQNPVTIDIGLAGVDAVNLLTGDAADEFDIDLLYPAFPVPALTVKSGGGNDLVGGTILGQAGPLEITLEMGAGDDRVDLDYTEAAAIVTGAGMGGSPHVKAFSGASSAEGHDFFAYAPQFTGGVRVAVGDVNGDGVQDIVTGAGPGGGPHVKVFDGRTGAELRSFFAYDPGFTGGVYVAAGDVNGDGYADIVTGADAGGGPHVRVFSGDTGAELRSFFAYSPDFLGGVRVATGDVNNDGFDDIITASGPGGGPHVKVFSGATGAELRSFFAYTPSFSGGVRVAAGDVNGDGIADIVTGAGPGAGPHVKVFDGSTGAEIRSFFAYDPSFTGGVYVAAGDVNSDAPATFDLAVNTGDGNDDVTLDFATGGSRTDRINGELGDGADRFELRWSGALQEPSVDLSVDVHVSPGGTGFLPEVEDEVLVSFEHGDPDRPLVLGAVWNSKDQPPPDDGQPPPDDQHLLMSLSSTNGVLSSSTEILGGGGRDEVTYFVRGRINAATSGPISAAIGLGDGADSMTIDFTGLEMEGPKKLAPISLDLRGGTGRDTLAFMGTAGNDKFTLTGRSILLEGAATANFAGFEVVQVYALGGNDQVTMTGFEPRIDWRVDGGDGHDRFLADFEFDRDPMLVSFEKVKLKKSGKPL